MKDSAESSGMKGHERLYGRIDWLFLGFLALEFVAFPLFPGLPLLPAAIAMATEVRTSKWRIVTLWCVAGILTLIIIAPFIIGRFNPTFVEVNTVMPVSPAGW